jgi:hypothetical protein
VFTYLEPPKQSCKKVQDCTWWMTVGSDYAADLPVETAAKNKVCSVDELQALGYPGFAPTGNEAA